MSFFPRTTRQLMAVFLFSLSLSVLYLSQRAVMNIGGFCARGGPFEISAQCPEGIPALATVAPLVMIASIFLYVFSSRGRLAGIFLMWAALFVSLGWNFLEFGLSPSEVGGRVYAWLVTGGLFILMGLAPLMLAVRGHARELKQTNAYQLLLFAGCALLGISAGIYLFN